MGTTANYSWVYPTVNADADAWGTILNTMAIAIDAQMFTNEGLAAPKASPTFTGTATVAALTATGTATFADAGTWSSAGIRGLTGLGIGFSGAISTVVDVRDNSNTGATLNRLQNSNVGTGVSSRFRNDNGSSIGDFVLHGTGFTTSGVLRQDGMYLGCNGGGGVTIATSGAARPIYFAVNSAEVGRFGTDGSFLLGSTTNAGAGAIGATGNITAFYSDDRLKTRLGPISGALEMVKSLDGFYYEENDFAVSLGYERKRQIGLSAQQTQKVIPEVIARAPISDKAKMELMTMHYDRIVAVLVEAIKELDAKKADA